MYIVIWQTSSGLYYKLVKGTYQKYYVGYENQYSHKVLLVIDLFHDLNIDFDKKKFSFRSLLINSLKHLLKKLERR